MIYWASGDILSAKAEALVNPVNIVGVMGGGLAAQFKEVFPEMYEQYREDCKHKRLKIGKMHVCHVDLTPVKYVINFPTKDHFKNPSKLSYIKDGLDDLYNVIKSLKITSFAIPKLGCGLGGLNSADVSQLIIEKFDKDRDLQCLYFCLDN